MEEMMVNNKLIELKNIVKSYDGEIVVDHMNLYIRENEFITLVGPSGCGKTTTLRMIGGFEKPDEGEIIMNGQVVNDLPPHKRLFFKNMHSSLILMFMVMLHLV